MVSYWESGSCRRCFIMEFAFSGSNTSVSATVRAKKIMRKHRSNFSKACSLFLLSIFFFIIFTSFPIRASIPFIISPNDKAPSELTRKKINSTKCNHNHFCINNMIWNVCEKVKLYIPERNDLKIQALQKFVCLQT